MQFEHAEPKASPRWGGSRGAGGEGAESYVTSIGAHSSVAYGATFPILGKATTRVRTHL